MKALLDLGTNTFHLLIAELKANKIIEHRKLQIPVKIGKGGINTGVITEDAFNRGMDALKQFRTILNEYHFAEVTAYGTSAIRDAANGIDFITRAHNEYGILIKAISGDEEAELIYRGVSHSFEMPAENVLVMDIGGGSVEFIIGNKNTILWKHSYPIGAARLLERFHTHDPMDDTSIIQLQSYLVHNIRLVRDALPEFPCHTLIGSAGSFETLVDVLKDDIQIPDSVIPLSEHATEITLDGFDAFIQLITQLDAKGRAELKGMVDFRVEMIVVAAILMDVVVKRFDITRIIASNYSLKEGMLFQD